MVEEFLDAFDSGNHVDLFILWQNHIPRPLLRLNSNHPDTQAALQLEFYLNLHCAVYPFRDEVLGMANSLQEASTACGKAMAVFRRYIESRGKGLSQTPEFIAFYALPYVPNPTEHPTFSPMFTSGWMSDLRLKLSQFVAGQLSTSSFKAAPAILDCVAEALKANDMEARVAEAKGREMTIVKFAESIYNVSLELWDSLKMQSDEGNATFLEEVGEQLKNFQNTFDQLSGDGSAVAPPSPQREPEGNVDYHEYGYDEEGYGQGESKEDRDLGPPQQPVQTSPRGHREMVSKMSSLAEIDIDLVKKDLGGLASSDPNDCALLLQVRRCDEQRHYVQRYLLAMEVDIS